MKNFEEIAVDVEEIRGKPRRGKRESITAALWRAQQAEQDKHRSLDTAVAVATCNKNGDFSCYFPLSEGVPYRLVVYHSVKSKDKKVAPVVSEPFLVENGKVRKFTLELKRGEILKGRLLRRNGSPVVKQTVPLTKNYRLHDYGTLWIETDEHGFFIKKGVKLSPNAVLFSPDFGPYRTYHKISKEEEEVIDIGDWLVPNNIK